MTPGGAGAACGFAASGSPAVWFPAEHEPAGGVEERAGSGGELR